MGTTRGHSRLLGDYFGTTGAYEAIGLGRLPWAGSESYMMMVGPSAPAVSVYWAPRLSAVGTQ